MKPIDIDFLSKNLLTEEKYNELVDSILVMESFESYSYREIYKLYFDKFKVLPHHINIEKLKTLKSNIFYRVRTKSEIMCGNSNISDLKTFAGPPIGVDTNFGRANWKKWNVFYASDSPQTAVFEKKLNLVESDEELFIASWIVDESKIDNSEVHLFMLNLPQLPLANHWYDLKLKNEEFVKSQFPELSEFNYKMIALSKSLGRLFCETDSSKYKLSAFISTNIIYRSLKYFNKYSILVYPSVENDFKSCNYALHPNFVKSYLKIKNVLNAKQIDDSSIIPISIGFLGASNQINWFSLNLDEAIETFMVKSLVCRCCDVELFNIDLQVFQVNNINYNIQKFVREYLYDKIFGNSNENLVNYFDLEKPELNLEIEITSNGKFYLLDKMKNKCDFELKIIYDAKFKMLS